MKNHSILNDISLILKYRTYIGSEFLLKPDNFEQISSIYQRFKAAVLVLSGNAVAVKWDTSYNYTTKYEKIKKESKIK